jgi:ribosomal-protein-alanine N-acetyltransferase
MEASNQPQPWTEGFFNDELAAENRSYLAAEDLGLVGFGGVMMLDDEAHVTNLLVSPSHRRRGIGHQLLRNLVETSIRQGARHLTLEVRSRNLSAQQMYSRFGMAPVGARPGYYGDDDALIMWVHDIDRPAYLEGLR